MTGFGAEIDDGHQAKIRNGALMPPVGVKRRLISKGNANNLSTMSKEAVLESTSRNSHYRAQAKRYLTETNRILKRLANERRRHDRRRKTQPNIVEEAKAILRGA